MDIKAGFFIAWWDSEDEWFWLFKSFSKLKTTFTIYWTSIKIKISMKEYEIKNANGTGAMTKAKNEVFIGL